ncbi:MAG: DNA adenine methylase [Ignavibacteriales bacterium]|nr:DNA adenine methylase [Ignavibacteriales bacterium]
MKKLIERYAKKDDLVADLFAGCGTTLVESKIHGKRCVGVDINPVSRLITEAKTNAIEPRKLDRYFQKVLRDISKYKYDKSAIVQKHQRLVYWFGKRRRAKIDYLYKSIAGLRDKNVKIFFQCALSNILKNCSRWLQTSTKPQIDPDKKSADPFLAFKYQAKRMISQNKTYYNHLKAQKILSTSCKIKLADAKHTGIRSNSVGIIITSPPYVTSYEYADIHQLTGYWFSYFKNIHTFRRKFIGTFYSGNNSLVVNGALAQQTVQKLFSKDPRTAKEVANFFNDMDHWLSVG